MVKEGAFSHKIDYFNFLGDSILEGHVNHLIGSKVAAIKSCTTKMGGFYSGKPSQKKNILCLDFNQRGGGIGSF